MHRRHALICPKCIAWWLFIMNITTLPTEGKRSRKRSKGGGRDDRQAMAQRSLYEWFVEGPVPLGLRSRVAFGQSRAHE